ncbi:MAG: DUF2520 domain-containing protein, partial [Bacteroidota bacterium]|nr:DUF2520 domain-containing protein [Bacteroidota bacterium]
VVVHTAASVSKEILSSCSTAYGVMYPLQSLKQEVSVIPPIPVLLDGNSEGAISIIKRFALSWADNVQIATDEERLKLHLAAVFVNNFTNHLFALIEDYCEVNGLNYNILERIIEETMLRVKVHSPAMLQTGPAIRKDLTTIKRHQELLVDNGKILDVYNVLTDSIMAFYKTDKG